MVAKVGGSLYDLPDLAHRLRNWLNTTAVPVLLVPGGGDGAEVIRRVDETHLLGEAAAHWLALRVLSVNSHFLAELLAAPVVSAPDVAGAMIQILDPFKFCQADEGRPGSLPHAWTVTSDAIAARVAEIANARLVLLKSTDLPEGVDWEAAATTQLVDETLPSVVTRGRLYVEWVNLRSPRWSPGSLRGGNGPDRR